MMPYGVIKGVVRDSYRNLPLGYATILIVGTTSGAMSQRDGSYAIRFVPPGTYQVKAMMMAYHTVSFDRIVVRMGEETDIPITLEEKWLADDRRRIVGTHTRVTIADVRCQVLPMADTFHVGDAPAFRVVISNLSDEWIYLVRAVDGSFEGIRYPMMSVAIDGPGGKSASGGAGCGNANPLELSDFSLVEPAGDFEPFDVYQENDRFTEPGEYKVTFKYSTNSIDYKFWGDQFAGPRMHPSAWALLTRVPRLEIEESIVVQVVD